jgi:hypothetical protein
MYGIRIVGKHKYLDQDEESLSQNLDFELNDILICIGDYASDLYWAHTGIIYSFPEGIGNDEYNDLNNSIKEYVLHESDDNSIQYMHKGFIEKLGRYIYTDSLYLAGYEDIESLKTFDPSIQNFNDSKAYIYFRCTDAKYWDVYLNELNIVKMIQGTFNYTEDLNPS